MTNMEALNILGLSRKFTQEEAKLAYRKLARKYHPDIAGIEYNAKFAEINEAYDKVLKMGNQKINCTVTSCKYNENQEQKCNLKQIIVTPKEIDFVMEKLSDIVSYGINRSLHDI